MPSRTRGKSMEHQGYNLIVARQMVEAFLDADIPVFLWGAPGIGKSALVSQIALARVLPLIDLRAVQLDPVDLRGLPSIANGRAVWAIPSFLPDADRDGPEGILFLDELNAAPPLTQAACFQLILDRRLGDYRLPPGWRIVAAGNRQSDRSSAQRMPTALANRFAHIDVVPDIESFLVWASSVKLAPIVCAFLKLKEKLLHNMDGSDGRTFPSPRTWELASRLVGLPDQLRLASISSLVGAGPASEFDGFLRIWQSLPTIESIIRDPVNARLPTDASMYYAVAASLARKATRANFAAILTYGARLPREFETVITAEAVKGDATLKETAAYIDWASRNSDVVL